MGGCQPDFIFAKAWADTSKIDPGGQWEEEGLPSWEWQSSCNRGGVPVCEAHRAQCEQGGGFSSQEGLTRPLGGVQPQAEQQAHDAAEALAHGEHRVQSAEGGGVHGARHVPRAPHRRQTVQLGLHNGYLNFSSMGGY